MARAGIACAANFLVAQHGNGAVDIEAVPGDLDVLLLDDGTLVHGNHILSVRLGGVRCLGAQAFPDSYRVKITRKDAEADLPAKEQGESAAKSGEAAPSPGFTHLVFMNLGVSFVF